jgi:putative GTP pyrophosphokinase
MADALPEGQLEAWTAEFDGRRPIFEKLRDEVDSAITEALETQAVKIQSYSSRLKERDSFREKVRRKRYRDPFHDMHDLVGARIVCLFLDDLSTIDKIIRATFQVVSYEDKTNDSSTEVFGYRAVHYDCEILASQRGRYYEPIKSIVFEIQVRTILQDAWASVEHYLGYKGHNSVPDESKRDFGALVGLFHLADKTFQQIKYSSARSDLDAEAAVKQVTAEDTPGVTADAVDMGINRSTIKALLRQLFSERRVSEDAIYSDFVEELTSAEVTGINRLKHLLLSGKAAAEESEAKDPPPSINGEPSQYTDVGLGRMAMDLALPGFKEVRFRTDRTS